MVITLKNLFIKQAGMPVMKAIQAATIINAKILEMDTQIGALEPIFGRYCNK
jgi:imidazolonepropionase-like amidohydrolase